MTRSPQRAQLDLDLGEELTGEVLGVVYADRTTGFGVVELGVDGDAVGGLRCAGPLAHLVEGQVVRVVGAWREHPRHGETFEATFYEQVTPTSTAGLRTFLLSRERFPELPVDGVEQLIAVFGERVGWVIEREPGRLVTEAGLEQPIADHVHASWMAGRAYADLVRLLAPVGLPNRLVRGAFAAFGIEAVGRLRSDPYLLVLVEGSGFGHADALGRHLGVEAHDERRLRAAALAAHAAARRRDGHLYLTRAQCVDAVAGLLRSDAALAAVGVDAAVDSGLLVTDEVATPDGAVLEAIYTPRGLAAERQLATDVRRLLSSRPRFARLAGTAVTDVSGDQAAAVVAAFAEPVSVLTGGPGTGKTHALRALVAAATGAGLNVALCAPTGRAAKRIEELVGHPASTIHRLLEARPHTDGDGFGFTYGGIVDGEPERLPHDVVICDEFSMCDTELAASLLAAVDDGTHLVVVGDPDQLPPVGPGDVLRDLIVAESVPSHRLTEVHRQGAESRIVRLAYEVNRGEEPELAGVDGDVFMAEEPVRDRIVPRVVEAVAHRIPAHLGVDPDEIQVIAPVYRGPAGVDALNAALKDALNPTGGLRVAGFEEGDRVMQTRNDPERDVSNGDVGRVVDVDGARGELRVAFPRGEVVYTASQARDLVLAWAMTVHKSQGGEWPVVVFVCDRSHRSMLWRNLAYTAVTRAQRALVIVGQREAVRAAAAQDRPRNRQSLLLLRLMA